MFDIGWTELLILAVVAVIIVGPKDLPRMLRSLGRYANKVRQMAGEFRDQFDEAIRESELEDLRSSWKETSNFNPVSQVRDSVTESMSPLKETAEDIKGGIEKSDSPGGKEGTGRSTAGASKSKGGPSGSKAGGGSGGKSGGAKSGASGGKKPAAQTGTPAKNKTAGAKTTKSRARAGAAARSGD